MPWIHKMYVRISLPYDFLNIFSSFILRLQYITHKCVLIGFAQKLDFQLQGGMVPLTPQIVQGSAV